MGDAVILCCFRARTAADPHAERSAFYSINPIRCDGEAIV
jgi:hypothetical protein